MSGHLFIFGNSIASILLAKALLRADKNTRRKVATHIQSFCRGLRSLEAIETPNSKMAFANMWLEKFINHNLKIVNLPDFNFDTTMKNVLKYRFRLWLETEEVLVDKRLILERKVKNAKEVARAKEWIKNNIP